MKTTTCMRALALLCLLGVLLRPLPLSAAPAAVRHNNETVTEVYSFDRTNRAYHPVTGAQDIADSVKAVRGFSPSNHFAKDSVGFLIFTEGGRYTYYASPAAATAGGKAETAMIAQAQKMNARYPGVAQWLAYMDVANIERIAFDAFAGGPYYSNDVKKYPKEFAVSVNTTDRDEIEQVAAYLKRLAVDPGPEVARNEDEYWNPSAAGGVYSVWIDFKGGVRYHIFGDYLIISSSDMKEQIAYAGKTEEIRGLRDLMAGLPSAKREYFD